MSSDHVGGLRVSQSPYEGQGIESRWCVPQPEPVTLPQPWRLSGGGNRVGCSDRERRSVSCYVSIFLGIVFCISRDE